MSVGMFLNCRQMFQVVRINFTFHADVGDINHMKETAYKILFLEDEPTIREVLTEYMLMSGYQVTTAERGDAAVCLVREQDFDLAVLDICVPGEDGFEVLKCIHACRKKTAVIMLTAL